MTTTTPLREFAEESKAATFDDSEPIVARLEGPMSVPDTAESGRSRIDAEVSDDQVEIDFIPRHAVMFDDDGEPCEKGCDDD